MNELYLNIIYNLLKNGVITTSRGLKYLELKEKPQIIEINPLDSLVTLKARKLNYAFNIIEKMSYISGVGFNPNIITSYNKNYNNFLENGFIDPGSYGYRISQQLYNTYNTLQNDRSSRQAVINIYNYLEDNRGDRRNVPCTIALNFYIDNNKLNMIAFMRSNDIIWGFPYDVSQFSFIQEVLAAWLKIKSGSYKHIVTSLHLYENSIQHAEEILARSNETNFHTQQKWINKNYNKTMRLINYFWNEENKIRIGINYDKTNNAYINNSLSILERFWKSKKLITANVI